YIYNVGTYARKKFLWTERCEDIRVSGVDVAESDRRARGVDRVRADLHACPRRGINHPARRIYVEKVIWLQIGGGKRIRHAIPVYLSPTGAKRAGHVWVQGPEVSSKSVHGGLDRRRIWTGGRKDDFDGMARSGRAEYRNRSHNRQQLQLRTTFDSAHRLLP